MLFMLSINMAVYVMRVDIMKWREVRLQLDGPGGPPVALKLLPAILDIKTRLGKILADVSIFPAMPDIKTLLAELSIAKARA